MDEVKVGGDIVFVGGPGRKHALVKVVFPVPRSPVRGPAQGLERLENPCPS